MAPPPKNSPVIAGHRAAAKMTMTASALPLWRREAALGMLARPVPSLSNSLETQE